MERSDLTEASLFETASFLATVLSARLKTAAGIEIPAARSAISAVRKIELPKADPRTHICSGLFRSRRCELIVTRDKLLPDWLAPRKEVVAREVDVAGRRVTEIVDGDDKILVLQLAADLICVSNDEQFLAEVIALAGGKKTASIESATAFSAAVSLIQKSSPFWCVRLFAAEPNGDDPTSIQNPESIFGGIQDSKVVFIALDFPRTESKELLIHYASRAGREATDRFASMLGSLVQKSRTQEQSGTPNGEPPYTINSLTCDLSSNDLNQDEDDPMVAFVCVIAALLGQGLLL
ncbi:MAG TPA: hypothetical protein VHY91_15865 [Pirellulales bacterium]|nr:hypothetical protein [Pirellulales bacterium]